MHKHILVHSVLWCMMYLLLGIILPPMAYGQTLNPAHTGVIFRNENVHVNVDNVHLNVYGNLLFNNTNAKITNPQGTIILSRNWYNHANNNVIDNLSSSGPIIFLGTNAQKVSGDFQTEFGQLVMDKTAENLELLQPVLISNSTTFNQGNVVTSPTSTLFFRDDAVAQNASQASYVDGLVIKQGNDAFVFPTGNTVGATPNYLPIAISAPNSTSTIFRAQFFKATPPNSTLLASTLESINPNEYWTLTRDAGTDQVTVTPSWNSNSGVTPVPFYIKVAGYDGSVWQNYQAANRTILPTNPPLNTITSASPIGNYQYFAIGEGTPFLAEAVLKKKLDGGYHTTTNDMLRFKFEEQYNDNNLTYNIYNDLNNIVLSQATNPLTVQYGYNRYALDVSSLNTGFYTLEVINDKKEKWLLRFKR